MLNQTLKDIQIILINDGSTDNSLEICRKFEKIDDRILVIDKVNGGVSSARNAGIEAASGEYIGFLDPDDWIEQDMFENMLKRAKIDQSDICICNYFEEKKNNSNAILLNTQKTILKKDEIIDDIVLNMIGPQSIGHNSLGIMGSVWRLLIRRELIFKHGIRFLEGIPFMEDTIFSISVLLKSKLLSIDNACYYHYMYNDTSATRYFKKNLRKVQKRVLHELEQIIINEGIFDVASDRLDMTYLNMAINAIVNESHKNNTNNIWKRINAISDICRDQKIKEIVASLNDDDYLFRRKIVILAIKYKLSMLLYFYYRVRREIISIKQKGEWK